MKKQVFLLFVLASFLAMTAFAGPRPDHQPTLNFGKNLNAAQCNGGGKMVINVVQQVLNDADSGVKSPVWAFDTFTRQIQVWQTGAETFCATVKYHGSWITIAGPSPNGSTTIAAGIEGVFEGGYTALISGALKAAPLNKTRGNIGTVDYGCDATGNCPGYQSWLSLYFDGTPGFNYVFWGWVYHGGQNGAWVNASTGNFGDIHN